MAYILLAIGFVLLIKGADYFVSGASGLAKKLRVPALLIGMTIVAFGTSAPEAAVSISATLKGNSGIAIGNILGSNLFNASFIIGLAALLYPLRVEKQTVKKEIPIMLLSALALLALGADTFLTGRNTPMILERGDGIVLLLFFSVFMYYSIEVARNSRESMEIDNVVMKGESFKLALYTLGGVIAIIFGGNIVVTSATNIARSFGLSETIIGLTIVAIGTSLPELVTSVVAAIKKQPDIAIGNIVGSNIFNGLFIIGISSVIRPLVIDGSLIVELILNVIITVVLLCFSRSHHRISKPEGTVLLCSYLIYTVYLVLSVSL
ncbi:MAG: calcium/sodium antiporter [Peptostreptococcaceae bacterium]|nr:calcium/sodium antiporter [Peptostreptococcaceae bacterium]